MLDKLKEHNDGNETFLFRELLRNLDILTDYQKPGRNFYPTSEFDFVKELEDNYETIKQEFLQLEADAFVSPASPDRTDPPGELA